jgi:hypothetical protein
VMLVTVWELPLREWSIFGSSPYPPLHPFESLEHCNTMVQIAQAKNLYQVFSLELASGRFVPAPSFAGCATCGAESSHCVGLIP